MTFPTYKDIAWFSIMYRHLTNDVSFHLKDEWEGETAGYKNQSKGWIIGCRWGCV